MKTYTIQEADSVTSIFFHIKPEPVQFQQQGETLGVFFPESLFDTPEYLYDALLHYQAEHAKKEGFLSVEETDQFIKQFVHA